MRFRRGLIVGKFSPLHRGHQHLIDTALRHCDEVVLVSYTKPGFPGCSTERRRRWLAALYPQTQRLVVDDDWLAARAALGLRDPYPAIPADDEPDDLHRRFTAWLCSDVLGLDCDAVFTSEAYGEGFANALRAILGHPVQHISVDRERLAVPVSGTALRQNARLRRDFMAPVVATDLPLRIVFLGGESTGKTTLCRALAMRWQVPLANEYGRELWVERDGQLALPDLLLIGRTQVAREERLMGKAAGVVICDTSPLTTTFYSHALFGSVDPELARLAERPYDLTFLCLPDFPFVQDGTRQDVAFQAEQQRFYERALAKREVPFFPLGGPLEKRIAAVEAVLGATRGSQVAGDAQKIGPS